MAVSLANSSFSPMRLDAPLDEKGPHHKQSMWHRFGFRRWLGQDRKETGSFPDPPNNDPSHLDRNPASSADLPRAKQDNITRRISRKVGVGLPRTSTFKRHLPEQRDRLAPLEPDHRRAQSADRHPLGVERTRSHSPLPTVGPRLSAPEVQWLGPAPTSTVDLAYEIHDGSDLPAEEWENPSYQDVTFAPSDIATERESILEPHAQLAAHEPDTPITHDDIEMELENKWILNLSMHFRDNSGREKFFVTYAETPTKWRRVTISMDYHSAPPDSLERDVEELRYQRDKCAKIYESIRESLAEIQFYDTVTNLKVETLDGRLHVHVTEDVNETIPYPPIASVRHLRGAQCVPEHLLHFESHLSGFVYKVQVGGRPYIKKEIPGPDTVDEFLYEINALHALNGAPNVIRVEGIVVDEHQEVVKGLLINYAEQGALVDLLYEQRGNIPFQRRERWAKQIVQGLCEIHETGYVQGDFTLSNIVVDENDDAQIIDINRRGCPVGWEPPEIAAKIESNQRISMYIGVKTDLYQLGMTLWALATGEDEPERQPRPLVLGQDVGVPDYYRRLVDICLSPMPRHRLGAKELLHFFPPDLLLRSMYRHPRASFDPNDNASAYAPMMSVPQLSSLGSGVHPRRSTAKLATEQSNMHTTARPRRRFLSGHEEGKRSTLTLTESTEDTDFPPRHSSASTLNHDGPAEALHCADSPVADSDLAKLDAPRNPEIQGAATVLEAGSVPNREHLPYLNTLPLSEPSNSYHEAADNRAQFAVESSNCNDVLPYTLLTNMQYEEAALNPTQQQVRFENQTHHNDESVASLLTSALPINPALDLAKRRSLPSMPTESLIGDDRTFSEEFVSSLSESCLPINPAASLAQHKSLPNISHKAQLSEPVTSRNHNSFLLESILPINPAFHGKVRS
ncbi:hypothetical protein N7539_005875 [Penicillium diatomitis]|uniref:Protein kinase domain-containing protein n=1 Tax=Penicillium diatomitis TaxID=2819901 RepID=A0A9W9X594_9EURO|nr:uncharacterized protein N7539_005875 [Penicillium diatomitis]KAJ5484079.1 hypothetical protein N7539_005875 [Penicillium diatomitis]